jgi:3-hexulose-6-phosphate synthase
LELCSLTAISTQVSLDLTDLPSALDMARVAVRAGIDWLEAGTPLIMAEGLRSVRALRAEFPDHPIVADLKMMDGGSGESEMAFDAGASYVVVMSQAQYQYRLETTLLPLLTGCNLNMKPL